MNPFSRTRATFAGAATLSFALFSPLACSSTVNGSDLPPLFTEASLEAACSHDYDVYRARALRCTGANPDPADTRAASIQGCKDYASLPGVKPTPAMFDACTRQEESAACDEPLTACQWPGSMAKGAACNFGSQCTSGYCVLPTNQVTGADGTTYQTEGPCGVCGDTIPAGATCDGTSGQCATGYKCIDTKCQPIRQKGESCRITSSRDERDCASPLRCIGGTCAPRLAAGAICARTSECQAGNSCSNGICTKVTWALPGDACNDVTIQCAEGVCNTVSDAQGNPVGSATCSKVLKDGEACTIDASTTACGYYSQCANNVCAPYYTECH